MNLSCYSTVRLQYICITDIDECADNPCVHGNCTDGINNHTCECDDGYEGDNCDIGKCILILVLLIRCGI